MWKFDKPMARGSIGSYTAQCLYFTIFQSSKCVVERFRSMQLWLEQKTVCSHPMKYTSFTLAGLQWGAGQYYFGISGSLKSYNTQLISPLFIWNEFRTSIPCHL